MDPNSLAQALAIQTILYSWTPVHFGRSGIPLDYRFFLEVVQPFLAGYRQMVVSIFSQTLHFQTVAIHDLDNDIIKV